MLRRVLLLLLLCLCAGEARANYTEAHVGGEDARVVIERDGRMVVTHALAYRVLAGTLRSIALSGFEDDLRFRPTATVTASDGHTYGASVVRDDKDIVHVTVDDPKGLKRGDYRFEMSYEGSLTGRRVTRDGAFDRVRFALPPMREGVDSARVVLDLPSAPTEPRAAGDQNEADIATLRRSAERDELELVRPHVAKAEAATFFARVDPKALSLVDDPALRVPVVAPKTFDEEPARTPIGTWTLVAACALAVFGIALAKGRITEGMRGLVPVHGTVRAVIAAALFAAGVRVQIDGRLVVGAALVACALPLLAWRARSAPQKGALGPATWVAMKPDDAFSEESSRADFLDGTTMRGAIVSSVIAIAVLVATRFVAPYVVAMDALVLVPIFFTGTSCQRPASAAREATALARIGRALEGVDVAAYARVAQTGNIEQTRLRVMPTVAMPGLLAIEVGVAWEWRGAWLAAFDVLVRVTDGSFASAKMTTAFPRKRALPGRQPEERVFRFEPDGWTDASCAARVMELADVLRDRRVVIAGSTERAFDGIERRLPPNRRPAQQAAA